MNHKGDVWISTVLYTLIGLAMIASLVAIIQPEVSKLKDKFVIEQTAQSLNVLDDTILRTREATGTRLNYIIRMDKGNFIIDGVNEIIYWQTDSNYQFSEENRTINLTLGNIKGITRPKDGIWNVTLLVDYRGYGINITVNDKDELKTLNPSSLAYSIWITNKGIQQSGVNKVQQIDFSVI
jgi:hypothetical protein